MVDEVKVVKNIYQKMIDGRSLFQNTPKKKSGENKFAHYSYYQLDDIVPILTKIETSCQLLFMISFEDNKGILTVVNAEKPEETLTYSTPTSLDCLAQNKMKPSEIQQIGAMETYSRRYLYLMALDVVESDAVDATMGEYDNKPQNKPQNRPQPQRQQITPQKQQTPLNLCLSEAEAKQVYTSLLAEGVSKERIGEVLKNASLSGLTKILKNSVEAFMSECRKVPAEEFEDDIQF